MAQGRYKSIPWLSSGVVFPPILISAQLWVTQLIQGAKPNPVALFQTHLWGGWDSVFPEPRSALKCCLRVSAPLLPLRRLRLLAGLSLPAGILLPSHADVFQPSDPSDTGAKRHPGLAQEAALAQVLPRLQTAHHGKGKAGNGGGNSQVLNYLHVIQAGNIWTEDHTNFWHVLEEVFTF